MQRVSKLLTHRDDNFAPWGDIWRCLETFLVIGMTLEDCYEHLVGRVQGPWKTSYSELTGTVVYHSSGTEKAWYQPLAEKYLLFHGYMLKCGSERWRLSVWCSVPPTQLQKEGQERRDTRDQDWTLCLLHFLLLWFDFWRQSIADLKLCVDQVGLEPTGIHLPGFEPFSTVLTGRWTV